MKKGFTLIELLAVIVILAIIALIATPIVLNIINETKESASLRSAEMYLDAVEQGITRSMLQNKYITDGTYNITKDGDICLENFDSTNKTCPDINTLKVEVDGEKPESGNIDIKNGNIGSILLELNYNKMAKNDKGEVIMHPCILVSDADESNSITPGDKYECKVDPNKDPYTFYVLSYSDKDGNVTNDISKSVTTNLILDRNVYYDKDTGESGLTDEDHIGDVEWISEEDYVAAGGSGTLSSNNTDYGPITAMNYLENATSSWTNLQKKTINEFEFSDSEGNFVKNQSMKTYNVYARLPYLNEVSQYNGENRYLYEYLSEEGGISSGTTASPVQGYWTFTTHSDIEYFAWHVLCYGYVSDGTGGFFSSNGVRPVINLKL